MAIKDNNTPRPNNYFKDWGFNRLIKTIDELEQQGAELTYPDFTVYFPDHSEHLPSNLYVWALGYIDAVCATDINVGQVIYPTSISDIGNCDPENILNPFEHQLVSWERVFNTDYFNSCNKSSRLLFLAVANYINYKTEFGIPKEPELMPILNRYAFWIMFYSCIQ